jgi:uncharacterized protein YjiS (DUF1127 family)
MSLHDRIQSWRDRREREREIARLTPQDIADLGLSRQDVLALARMPAEQVARMEEMARLHGVDPESLDAHRDLRIAVALTCAQCGENSRCRRAIEDGLLAEEAGFCPNHETYRTLAAG